MATWRSRRVYTIHNYFLDFFWFTLTSEESLISAKLSPDSPILKHQLFSSINFTLFHQLNRSQTHLQRSLSGDSHPHKSLQSAHPLPDSPLGMQFVFHSHSAGESVRAGLLGNLDSFPKFMASIFLISVVPNT
jgi:hypothetical protein